MSRSKEITRIERAIKYRDKSELMWALEQCETRRKFVPKRSSLWYDIEKRVRAALNALDAPPEAR